MAFPDAPRVVYGNSPLDEVICQLKFPPILRIEAELPASFQERVRGDFPRFETVEASPLPANLPDDLARLILQAAPAGTPVEHVFASGDAAASWQLRLARARLSLSCCDYGRWEQFRQRLAGPYQALIEQYRPAAFNHVCLRYRNVIRRSRLQLDEVPWAELLRPWVCGFLAAPGVAGEVAMARMKAATRLPGEIGWLDVEYGLAQEVPDGETTFVIDAHLFDDQQTETTDAFARLDSLHRQAGLFFRWCIADRLHHALRPAPLALAIAGGE